MKKCNYDSDGIEEEVLNIFASRLKKIRISAKLTQQEFANEIGISVAALSYYEKGKRSPDIIFLSKVCDYFNVSTEYLLGYTNSLITENVEISKMLGLSDKAINNIRRYIEHSDEGSFEDYANNDILNKILESEDFYNVLDLMTWSGFDFCERVPDKEYIEYIATKKMMHAISKAVESMPSMEGRILEALIPEQKEREQYSKWIIEENEKQTDELLKHFEYLKEELRRKVKAKTDAFKESTRGKAIEALKEAEKYGEHNTPKE